MIKRIFRKISNIVHAIFNFVKTDSPNIYWVEKSDPTIEFSHEIPKVIWIYWDSEQKNDLVEFCIYNTRKICVDYEIFILNKKNVHEYIELPKFKEGLQVAVIADYIRLSLLKKYGGIWMDASILLTENFDWLLSKMNNSIENFVFYTDDCTTNLNQPIAENWFIVARKESKFINDWFAEFEKCCLSEYPNSYYKSYEGSRLIQNIPNTDYLMCYISAAIVTSKKQYSILYANSGSVGHYYNYRLRWFSLLIALKIFFCKKELTYIPKLVKFTSSTRRYPNLFVKVNVVFRMSMFGHSFKEYLKDK